MLIKFLKKKENVVYFQFAMVLGCNLQLTLEKVADGALWHRQNYILRYEIKFSWIAGDVLVVFLNVSFLSRLMSLELKVHLKLHLFNKMIKIISCRMNYLEVNNFRITLHYFIKFARPTHCVTHIFFIKKTHRVTSNYLLDKMNLMNKISGQQIEISSKY